jgi:nicotinamide-nucleotide amidase
MNDLAARLLAALRGRGWTLATAESCTGGLLGDALTDIAGSSDVYLGGVVAYANSAKIALLGVPADVLASVGAVSAETAVAMAAGASRQFGAQVALATTGIAGPGGGSPEKPVGLVYLGLATPDGVWTERHLWPGDRRANKVHSAERALAWAIERLAGPTQP